MSAAENSQQGIQRNANGTMTIDCALVEQMFQEKAKLKSDLEAAINDCNLSKRQLSVSENHRKSLQSKLDKNTSESIANLAVLSDIELKRKAAEEKVRSLQEQNETLRKESGRLILAAVESETRTNEALAKVDKLTQELEASKSKFQKNNDMWNTKFGKLNSQYSKQQSELQKITSNKTCAQLMELQQLMVKLTTQINTTTKKYTKEMQNKKRPISEAELDGISKAYQQNVKTLAALNITLEKQDFPVMFKAYRDLCEKNDKKLLATMKSIFDIKKEAKSLNDTLQTEIPKTIQKVKSLTEKYIKEIEALKQKSMANEFKQEEKLYADLLPTLEEMKVCPSSVPNNLNKSSSKKNVPNLKVGNPSCSQPVPSCEDTKTSSTASPKEFDFATWNDVFNYKPVNTNFASSQDASNLKADSPSASKATSAFEDTKTSFKISPNNFNITTKNDLADYKTDNLTFAQDASNLKTDNPSGSQDIPKSGSKNSNKKKNKNKKEEKPSPSGWNFDIFDSKPESFDVILHDFPENTLPGVERDAVDEINIKYFLGKLDLGDIENVCVTRLPINNNEKVRPVLVHLSNADDMDRLLASTQKFTEMGLKSVNITKLHGKM